MAITGVGTGINELTVLAGVAELVPVSQRGYYLSGIVLTIIPFIPAVMWSQLIASSSSWRYIGVVSASTAGIALVLTFLFYSPPAQTPEQERARGDKIGLLKRMDLIGGLVSITGLAGLEVGLLGGGYQVYSPRLSTFLHCITNTALLRTLGQARRCWLPSLSEFSASFSLAFGRFGAQLIL